MQISRASRLQIALTVWQPQNYFTDIEQAAFSPGTMVPGLAPSADPGASSPNLVASDVLNASSVLQARLFAYGDAARYRLGVNYQQLPTNAAKAPVYCPFERDGKMRFDDNYGSDPNYVGSSLKPTRFYQDMKGSKPKSLSLLTEHEKWVSQIVSYVSDISDDDFIQPAALWDVIGRQPGHQERTVDNVAAHLKGVKSSKLRNDVYGMFPVACESSERCY